MLRVILSLRKKNDKSNLVPFFSQTYLHFFVQQYQDEHCATNICFAYFFPQSWETDTKTLWQYKEKMIIFTTYWKVVISILNFPLLVKKHRSKKSKLDKDLQKWTTNLQCTLKSYMTMMIQIKTYKNKEQSITPRRKKKRNK